MRFNLKRLCLDLFFPRECICCTKVLKHNSDMLYLCSDCVSDIKWVNNPSCCRCGRPFHGEIEFEKECKQCEAMNPAFSRGRVIMKLDGVGRKIVHTLKYNKGKYLLEDIIKITGKSSDLGQYLENATLIPVPLHPLRYMKRGFNQSLLIANSLRKTYSNVSLVTAVQRVKYTPSQTALRREKRMHNVKSAFCLKSNVRLCPSKRYIIVDDVYTTGSTINACSELLKQNGIEKVDFLALSYS